MDTTQEQAGTVTAHTPGMTKREYFAAAAMQGLMASKTGESKNYNRVPKTAVAIADALLAELALQAQEVRP